MEGWSKATPEVAKWTKATVGQHITVGGLGATPVGTPQQVADNMEKWVKEADVDGFNLVGPRISLPSRRKELQLIDCPGLCHQTWLLQGYHRSSHPGTSQERSILG